LASSEREEATVVKDIFGAATTAVELVVVEEPEARREECELLYDVMVMRLKMIHSGVCGSPWRRRNTASPSVNVIAISAKRLLACSKTLI
jgi:hypothetical protein